MKIVCVGRNYAEHARELQNPVPSEPVIFVKPETALLPPGEPFVLPSHSSDVHHELEVVVRMSARARRVTRDEASGCYEEIGLGIDFTARDVQRVCKEKGLPWEKAKAFDGSAPVGRFVAKQDLGDLGALAFHLLRNGNPAQQGNTRDLLFGFDELISYVSGFMTFEAGDLLFTGTPAGVGPVVAGDLLQGFLQEENLLEVNVVGQ
jgi:2-keto-4-pentenoate hydratase/2-oxohepta-3-ene-1,7-dioic acid hydratase in catechol pathway